MQFISLKIDGRLGDTVFDRFSELNLEDLEKKPGIAETLDWAAALAGLGLKDLTEDPVAVQASLVALLKTEADQAALPGEVVQRLAGVAG